MPWIIGIDEAVYGPNLGPLVMTSVASRVPERLAGADLWRVLRAAVRRHTEAEDDRPLVADSKLVYSTARGLLGLETGVLTTVLRENVGELESGSAGQGPAQSASPTLPRSHAPTLSHLIDRLCPAAAAELAGECWYAGALALPVEVRAAECAGAAERFERTCREREVAWGLVRSVVVCPPRFNAILDRWGTKAAVLGHGLGELVRCSLPAAGDEPASFFIDKHGGRNTYAAMLQDALPGGTVVAREEGRERSVYQVLGRGADLRLTFQPRADVEHFCVALASMVSKYLREVLMLEFNRFWQGHVPGLKPTAGYPGDAARFFEAIRPAARKLGVAGEALWRKR